MHVDAYSTTYTISSPKVVTKSSYEKTYTLSQSKQVIAKSLGRSSHKALFRHVTHHCLIYAVLPFAYDELLIKVLSWYRVPKSREELVLYGCDHTTCNNSMNELT